MTQHRGRYPFRIYALLVLYVALFAVLNTLFGNLLQSMVGHFDFVYLSVVSLGLVGYALLFAFIFWRVDRHGSIGRLLGAKEVVAKSQHPH